MECWYLYVKPALLAGHSFPTEVIRSPLVTYYPYQYLSAGQHTVILNCEPVYTAVVRHENSIYVWACDEREIEPVQPFDKVLSPFETLN